MRSPCTLCDTFVHPLCDTFVIRPRTLQRSPCACKFSSSIFMKLVTAKLYSSVFDIYKPQSSYPLPPTYFHIFAFLRPPGIGERPPGIGESCQNEGLWDISDIQASANVIQTSANVVRMKGYGTICIINVFQGRSARRPASP